MHSGIEFLIGLTIQPTVAAEQTVRPHKKSRAAAGAAWPQARILFVHATRALS